MNTVLEDIFSITQLIFERVSLLYLVEGARTAVPLVVTNIKNTRTSFIVVVFIIKRKTPDFL